MTPALLVMALLLCVAASAIAQRLLRLALPLTQILLGAAISLPSFGLHVDLDPKVFMLVFVPPLLFADGWRIPKREFFKMRERILGLALGLVLFTVVAIGYLLHWMIPALPLAAAFALAAVLSPTDAVSVTALAGRAGIPKQLMHTLQGEALMNDVSGLTAFSFAMAAATTGAFSLGRASLSFVILALGGLMIGAVMGWLMARFQQWLSGWGGVEAQGSIVMNLLMPFAAYLAAEEIGASGILAAVAAGMTLNLSGVEAADPMAGKRITAGHFFSMLEYIANGVIFVLLGLQLPKIIGVPLKLAFATDGMHAVVTLCVYALATAAALVLTRLIWVWIMLRLTLLYRHFHGGDDGILPNWRLQIAAALGGVRGAITLAGISSVPLLLDDGVPFPQRSLMVFIAATVILISLVAAAIGLPRLLRGLVIEEDFEVHEEKIARHRACEAAIAAIATEARRLSALGVEPANNLADTAIAAAAQSASRLIEFYQQRLRAMLEAPEAPPAGIFQPVMLEDLRVVGLRAERATILRMHRAHEINDSVLGTLIYELDVRETAHLLGPKSSRYI